MKPVIGITSDVETNLHTLENIYIKAITVGGGVPLIIPTGIEMDITQITTIVDGLLLSGGADICPIEYGEDPCEQLGGVLPERDSMELQLVRQMLNLDKPILGICRGQQILNIALGGTLYQDITSQIKTPLLQHVQKAKKDHQSHAVHIEKGSKLAGIASAEKIMVNSLHHQALKDIPFPLRVSGKSADGIVEAIESTEHRFALGVQWHPEGLIEKEDQVSLKLFKSYINACLERMIHTENHRPAL